MLPTDAKARKNAPMARGVLDYFPDALAAVAELSRIGNEQHNPGQPMHWAKEKSTDHADCILRHLVDRGKPDTDGVGHSVKVAWRALAMLQIELEAAVKKDDGWIERKGGKCPVAPGTQVEVRLRDGDVVGPRAADELRWADSVFLSAYTRDIIAYRVVE